MDQPVKSITPAPMSGRVASNQPESRKLGVILLTGVVIGSMIGGGSFNLPANMAGGAGLVAIAIAWVVTFIGMYFLSNSFRILSDKRPDLKGGIYSYAAAGFGPFAGFQMAWGLLAEFGVRKRRLCRSDHANSQLFFPDFWKWSKLAVDHRRLYSHMGHVWCCSFRR